MLALATAGCTREREGLALTAPFDRAAVVGYVTATWHATDEERAFKNATRLAQPEVRVQYRLDVESDLAAKAYLRLEDVALVDASGLALGTDTQQVACTIGSGITAGILAGDIWVARDALPRISDVRVSHHVVPLHERGRALYREWLLQGRPRDAAAIDAEIAHYAAAPDCTPR